MNTFKSGDKVISLEWVRAVVYSVRSVVGDHIQLVGVPDMHHYTKFELVQPESIGYLDPEEVAKALLQGKALEYYHDGTWYKLLQPKSVAVSFMQSGIFRYAAGTMDYYGTEIPKPSTKPLDTADILYWVDMRTSKVKRSPYNRGGVLYWDTPEQAQEALTAILKPFGIVPQPLDERLVQEQPR